MSPCARCWRPGKAAPCLLPAPCPWSGKRGKPHPELPLFKPQVREHSPHLGLQKRGRVPTSLRKSPDGFQELLFGNPDRLFQSLQIESGPIQLRKLRLYPPSGLHDLVQLRSILPLQAEEEVLSSSDLVHPSRIVLEARGITTESLPCLCQKVVGFFKSLG